MSLKAAAAAFNVSPATAHRWWHRWLGGERGGAFDVVVSVRSLEPSAPLATPARAGARRADLRLPPQDRLGAAPGRRRDRLRALDGLEGAQAGRDLAAAEACEGACQQLRVALPGRSAAHGHKRVRPLPTPGHRVTGDRSSQDRQHRDGIDIVHAIVDDHSRLAYAEIHADQKAATVAAFLERALAFYANHGIRPSRLMTDNAWAYARAKLVQQLIAQHGIRHLTTKPYRPRTNGKVERFHQTMAREWAYGLIYQSHHDRAAALPHWLNHYNHDTDHTARSEANPRSAAFTTSVGRTARGRAELSSGALSSPPSSGSDRAHGRSVEGAAEPRTGRALRQIAGVVGRAGHGANGRRLIRRRHRLKARSGHIRSSRPIRSRKCRTAGQAVGYIQPGW